MEWEFDTIEDDDNSMIRLITRDKKLKSICEYRSKDEVVVKAAFLYYKCKNPLHTFPKDPEIWKILKKMEDNSSTAGSDTLFHCLTDIICYSIKRNDGITLSAADIAASIVHGKPMSGDLSWVMDDGSDMTLREYKESLDNHQIIEPPTINKEESDKIVNAVIEKLEQGRETLEHILSFAYFYNYHLGGDNQFRFEVPHHIDWGMTAFGFTCVEQAEFDLILPVGTLCLPNKENATISSKTGQGVVHTENGNYHRRRKSKINTTKSIIMSNYHMSSTTESRKKPVFDILLIAQYNPYLCCGVAPYYNLVIRDTTAGTVCNPIPIDNIRWVIHPQELVKPKELLESQKKLILDEVKERKQPTLFARCLELQKI